MHVEVVRARFVRQTKAKLLVFPRGSYLKRAARIIRKLWHSMHRTKSLTRVLYGRNRQVVLKTHGSTRQSSVEFIFVRCRDAESNLAIGNLRHSSFGHPLLLSSGILEQILGHSSL